MPHIIGFLIVVKDIIILCFSFIGAWWQITAAWFLASWQIIGQIIIAIAPGGFFVLGAIHSTRWIRKKLKQRRSLK